MRAGAAAASILGMVAAGATFAGAAVTAAPPGLAAVGPTSSDHGFPTWYEDSNGLRLEQCLDITDPYCDPAFLAGEMPDGESPIDFPGNWPMESFYFQAGTVIDLPSGGSAGLVSALEATFANEQVKEGDQVVFGRVRFDIDFPGAGTYRVTHPYGVDTFEVAAAEADGYRYVEDITPAPGNFALALNSRVNPFLTWDTGLVEAGGNTYVGDPNVAHKVTGSALDTNFFRIEQVDPDGTTSIVGETDLFNIMGKVSTNSGVEAQKAVLNESADGRFLDVFGRSDAGDSLTVQGDGLPKATMMADGDRYFARIPLGDTPAPATVTVTNETDLPASSVTVDVSDEVTISSALYDTGSGELTVSASSTDQVDPPALTLEGFPDTAGAPTTLTDGSLTLTLASPPAHVTVTSEGGGSGSAPVSVVGPAMWTPPQTAAVISGPSTTAVGQSVTLSSASLNADTLQWSQTSGSPVAGVDGATSDSVTFTPDVAGELAFGLTATGPSGTSTTTFTVTVLEELPPPEPVALTSTASASRSSAMAGQDVTVSAAGSTGPAGFTYGWTQTGGPALAEMATPPTTESFTFKMPATTEPIVLSLTVSDGTTTSAPAHVTVTPIVDELTVGSAQFRAGKNEWRIEGTASITTLNTVRVYLQNADGSRGAEIGASLVGPPVAPATVGDWSVRSRGGVAPGTSTRLIVESSKGGRLANVTFTRR